MHMILYILFLEHASSLAQPGDVVEGRTPRLGLPLGERGTNRRGSTCMDKMCRTFAISTKFLFCVVCFTFVLSYRRTGGGLVTATVVSGWVDFVGSDMELPQCVKNVRCHSLFASSGATCLHYRV